MVDFRILGLDCLESIVELAQQHVRQLPPQQLEDRLYAMLSLPNYYCFGLMFDGRLQAMAGGHVHTRLLSGKQLAIDYIIVSAKSRSSGYGKAFLKYIEAWANEQHCELLAINTSLTSSKSQAFYHRAHFTIQSFHFTKEVKTRDSETNAFESTIQPSFDG